MSSRGAREGPEAGAEADVDSGFVLREGTGRAADLVGFGGVFRAAHPPTSATTAANTSVKRVRTRGDFAPTDPGQISMSLGYPKSRIVSESFSPCRRRPKRITSRDVTERAQGPHFPAWTLFAAARAGVRR